MSKILLIACSVLSLFMVSCTKNDSLEGYATPQMGTTAVDSITSFSAIAKGDVTISLGSPILERGFVYSAHNSIPTVNDNYVVCSADTGYFSCKITGLLNNTKYFLRAYSVNNGGTTYSSDRIMFKTAFAIGESYLGGTIFYIDASALHGLIAAPFDQDSNVVWGCTGTLVSSAESAAIGKGQFNTTEIDSVCTAPGIAARICSDLNLNGYSTGWYLPSLDELNQLYLWRNAVGAFANGYYWSSTEWSAGNASSINFADGTQTTNSSKSSTYYIRAIRAF